MQVKNAQTIKIISANYLDTFCVDVLIEVLSPSQAAHYLFTR